MKRQDVVDRLVEDEIDTLHQLLNESDYIYLGDIFRDGFKGYNNFTDIELEKEFSVKFDVDIIIEKE